MWKFGDWLSFKFYKEMRKKWDNDSLIVYYFLIIEDSVLLECILEIVMRVVCFKNYIYELFL